MNDAEMPYLVGKTTKYSFFFGQPLWHNAGYQKTLEHLIRCMQENQVQNLYYAPHPKERLEHFDPLEQLAVKYAFFHLLNENFQQDIFFSADIFLSSSSTSLYDAAYINKLFNNDATKSIALLFDEALKSEYRKINGFDGLPFVDNQSIVSVDSPDDLSNVLFETLNNQPLGRGNYACASSPTGARGCGFRQNSVLRACITALSLIFMLH